VEPVFVDIARHISRREKVLIVCLNASHRIHIQNLLQAGGVELSRIDLRLAPSNDTWARDHGPITLLSENQPLLLDFRFNGWGGKYAADLDNHITERLHQDGAFGKTSLQTIDLVLEGGSIETDGAGTLLTTARCLLSPARNPKLNRNQLETELKTFLGITRVLWLEHGYLAGDDTDSHIDTLARFCDPNTIAYVACPDRNDEHYRELKLMEQELQALRTPDGRPYRLIPLPWPAAKHNESGDRLPATYANFLIINATVLVPTYADPMDAAALACLRAGFPGRAIIGVPCLPLVFQYGSLHCVTMQLPAGVL
jgi:agmatine deiminase